MLLFQPPAHSTTQESWSPFFLGLSWWDVHAAVQTFLSDHLFPSKSRRKDTWSRGFTRMTEGICCCCCFIYKVKEQLSPLSLETQPSVVQDHRCRAESVFFWQNHELTWALVRNRPGNPCGRLQHLASSQLCVSHQTRGLSLLVSCQVRAFLAISLEPPNPPGVEIAWES